ncbi:MAG: hypothetical protein HGA33_01095 [Candidatus Moranbacteria bacterium]|nr:hypothetical protein [Candidatus Moranbacteria bacterium]
MSIKRLSFPIFITVAVFLGIFSVRPAVVSILEKRQVRSEKESEMAVVESTGQSLETLFASREVLLGQEEGKAVYDYLPVSVDQNRVVDTFNYYAMQSGIVIDSVVFEDKEKMKSPYFAAKESEPKDQLVPPTAPQSESFILRADIQGSYESMKTFLKEMSSTTRSYELISFNVEKKDSGLGSDGQPIPDSGILFGNFVAEFFYLPENRYPQGYLLPIFKVGEYDLSPIEELMMKGKKVPSLSEPEGAGRENPFIL